MKVKLNGTVVLEKSDRKLLVNAAALCQHLIALKAPAARHAQEAAAALVEILGEYGEADPTNGEEQK